MRILLLNVGLCFLASQPAMAQTQVVNINITSANGDGMPNPLDGSSAGPTIAPFAYSGTSWNDIDEFQLAAGVLDLLDSEGNATTVDISWDAAGGNASPFSFSTGGAQLDVLSDYFAPNNGFGAEVDPSAITISGLDPSEAYDLYFISQGDTAGQGGVFTINGVAKTSAGSDPAAPGFTEDENFILFQGISPNASGDIITLFDNAEAQFQLLNGIQITDGGAPELLCDVNGNGVCNSTDFAIIRDAMFTSVPASTGGDLTGDGFVDFSDYRRFKDDPVRQLGFDGASESAAVPEPAAIVITGLSLLTLARQRRVR